MLKFGFYLLLGLLLFSPIAKANETLFSALKKTYANNPELNAARAQQRAFDESVPQALSGFRPKITGTIDGGLQDQGSKVTTWSSDGSTPRGASVSIDQNLFDGFKSTHTLSAAEKSVRAGRQVLRNTEQNILFSAVEAYMNVLRDTAIHNLRTNNLEVMDEQVRQAKLRFEVGEVTRTDVDQSEARRAKAMADLSVADAILRASVATYIQIIGAEPKKLATGKMLKSEIPKTLQEAQSKAEATHPAILAALLGADAAQIQIKVTQADLYPSLGVQASLAKRYESSTLSKELETATVVARLSVPFYEGGNTYSKTRAARQTAEQKALEMDNMRARIRALVSASWSSYQATQSQLKAAQLQVKAAESALKGVREEAKVGQRTTLDVLNAQQEVLDARTSIIIAQRETVVASYRLLAATGALDAQNLNIPADVHYDETQHYKKVRNKWLGTTP